jgi:hypothetical protein
MTYAWFSGFNDTWNDFFDAGSYSFGEYWDDGPYGYKDHCMVYPTVDDVIDTVQWEGYREGIDDTRYLQTLLDAIAVSGDAAAQAYVDWLKTVDLDTQDMYQIRSDIVDHILRIS